MVFREFSNDVDRPSRPPVPGSDPSSRKRNRVDPFKFYFLIRHDITLPSVFDAATGAAEDGF